jgi:hypothetical protein
MVTKYIIEVGSLTHIIPADKYPACGCFSLLDEYSYQCKLGLVPIEEQNVEECQVFYIEEHCPLGLLPGNPKKKEDRTKEIKERISGNEINYLIVNV